MLDDAQVRNRDGPRYGEWNFGESKYDSPTYKISPRFTMRLETATNAGVSYSVDPKKCISHAMVYDNFNSLTIWYRKFNKIIMFPNSEIDKSLEDAMKFLMEEYKDNMWVLLDTGYNEYVFNFDGKYTLYINQYQSGVGVSACLLDNFHRMKGKDIDGVVTGIWSNEYLGFKVTDPRVRSIIMDHAAETGLIKT